MVILIGIMTLFVAIDDINLIIISKENVPAFVGVPEILKYTDAAEGAMDDVFDVDELRITCTGPEVCLNVNPGGRLPMTVDEKAIGIVEGMPSKIKLKL